MLLRGLSTSTIEVLTTSESGAALAIDDQGRSYFRDGLGIWQPRGRLGAEGEFSCLTERRAVFLPLGDDFAVVACEFEQRIYSTVDGGASWRVSAIPPSFEQGSFQRSDNSGLFYFFDADNWEVLVKVLDGCAINGHYWVLAAATTNVGYQLEVRDLAGTKTRTYSNPLGRAAPATIDLEAFSCP